MQTINQISLDSLLIMLCGASIVIIVSSDTFPARPGWGAAPLPAPGVRGEQQVKTHNSLRSLVLYAVEWSPADQQVGAYLLT